MTCKLLLGTTPGLKSCDGARRCGWREMRSTLQVRGDALANYAGKCYCGAHPRIVQIAKTRLRQTPKVPKDTF